jgi:hypothetical protein
MSNEPLMRASSNRGPSGRLRWLALQKASGKLAQMKPKDNAMNKHKWIICPCCDGESTVDNPAFSNGFTSSEWHDMHVDEQQA